MYDFGQLFQKLTLKDVKGRKVLIAPLDWGLGHATRCVPVITELLSAGFQVVVASSGAQKVLLQREFPGLDVIDLPGYGLLYGSGRWSTYFRILLQIPKIFLHIRREKKWLDAFLAKEDLVAIISDNRYGLYSSKVYSVLITHQLYLFTQLGKWVELRVQHFLYRLINRFSVCWVPDTGNNGGLAGKLSHPIRLPDIDLRYLGCLSRFMPIPSLSPGYDLIVLLSGPEPQRTIFEKILMDELDNYPGSAMVVRGLPQDTGEPIAALQPISRMRAIYNHLPARELK